MNMLKGMVLGFIAGIIAYVTFHEIVNAIFNHEGVWTGWGRPSWICRRTPTAYRSWPAARWSAAHGAHCFRCCSDPCPRGR